VQKLADAKARDCFSHLTYRYVIDYLIIAFLLSDIPTITAITYWVIASKLGRWFVFYFLSNK